jgi:CheY-like chemotaxis protein
MNQDSQKISVLITDDNSDNRKALADILQTVITNPVIEEAEDGEKAVAKVSTKIQKTGSSFDIIFMDFQMPVMDGEKATSTIRQVEHNTQLKNKSIIITWSTAKYFPYVEADDWLTKPTDQQNVKRILVTYGLIK